MISVLQSSLCIGDIASIALSRSSTEGAFIVSKILPKVERAPVLLTWLTNLHAHFPLLEYFYIKTFEGSFQPSDCVQIFFKLQISCLAAFVYMARDDLGVSFEDRPSYSHCF
jgi:hypothetical protein